MDAQEFHETGEAMRNAFEEGEFAEAENLALEICQNSDSYKQDIHCRYNLVDEACEVLDACKIEYQSKRSGYDMLDETKGGKA